MLLPSVFGEDLFDETFPFAGMTDRHGHDKALRQPRRPSDETDVREGEKSWELDVELPGFRKENISATLKDGYLTSSAEKAVEETQEPKRRGQCVAANAGLAL